MKILELKENLKSRVESGFTVVGACACGHGWNSSGDPGRLRATLDFYLGSREETERVLLRAHSVRLGLWGRGPHMYESHTECYRILEIILAIDVLYSEGYETYRC